MTYAIIPPSLGYPELMTETPVAYQAIVEAGASAATDWLSRPWDDGQPYYLHLAEVMPEEPQVHQDAFTAGYMGRIHQRLRSPDVAGPGQQLVSGSDELTMILFQMLTDVADQSGKEKLKAKSFAARDLMRRVEQLSTATHDVTDKVNAAGGCHE